MAWWNPPCQHLKTNPFPKTSSNSLQSVNNINLLKQNASYPDKESGEFSMKYLLLAGLLYHGSLWATAFCPLNEKGDLELPFGYEITSKKSSQSSDLITIEPSKNNPYGGQKQIWKLHRDTQGRIVKIESGLNLPTAQLVQFEIEKRKSEQRRKDAFSDPSYALVPNLSDLQKLSFDPIMKPIKYGGSIELTHESGECAVKAISEKVFDPAQKTSIENPLYDESFCPKIEKAFANMSKDIQECSDKSDREKHLLAQIRNSPSQTMVAHSSLPDEIDRKIGRTTTGMGGGGGSPAIGRSIASIQTHDSSFDMHSHLMTKGDSNLNMRDLNKICETRAQVEVRRTSNSDNSPAKARKN